LIVQQKVDHGVELKRKIETKQANVGVVGLGYVGLPTAVEKAREGFQVMGFDVSVEKVEKINAGINYIPDIEDSVLRELVEDERLSASVDFQQLNRMDVVLICVPTPIDEHKQPMLGFVESAAKAISRNVKKGTIVLLESTTYPGTTDEIVVPLFEEKGFKIGEDLFIGYTPERIDPGNKHYGLSNTPKIVGGITEACTEIGAMVVGKTAYKVSSAKIAEMSKVFENTFRFINIALVNETASICEKLGIDTWEMIQASGTKPYGFMPFQPGPGIGGHCIPVDPYYLTYKAKAMGQETKMIELAGSINDSMANYVVTRMMKMLNEEGKAMKGSKIAVLGLAYKKDINDLRESPVLPIVKELKENGAQLTLMDPYITKYGEEIALYSAKEVEEADIVLLATDHSVFPYEEIAEKAKMIFDTRNAFKEVKNIKAKYHKL